DRLVKLFSVDIGIITARIRGIKKSTAKLKMASETFCLAEYTLMKKNDYYQIIGANIIDSFFSIVRDYELFSLSNGLLEATFKSLPEKTQLVKDYINLLKSLKAICYEDRHPIYVVCHYISYLLDFLGYRLNVSFCANCKEYFTQKAYFDFDKGNFLCEKCNEYGQYVDLDFIKFVKLVAQTPLANSNEINFKELDLKPVLQFVVRDLEKQIDKKILSIKNYLEFMENFR
ncbi:MAG: DNA repair protein RecO, partial [Clostridia bacterium]|nr:DNA repair protein RecO [Clostridia bacterium]